MRYILPLCVAFLQVPAFRSEVRVVRVDAEVRQGSRQVDGLTKDDFRITDDGKPQTILHFGYTEEPLDVILLFDTSGSMLPALERVASIARIALGELRPDDRVAVMAFDADTDLIADFASDRAAVDVTIRNTVLRRQPVGFTRLQGAVLDAAHHFLLQPRTNRRHAVLVVTDNMGSSRDDDAVPYLWDTDAVVSAVVVPGLAAMRRHRMFFPPAWFGFGTVDGIVDKTGGDVLKGDGVEDNFRETMRRLRWRYTVHYAMPPAKPGDQRTLSVGLTRDAEHRFPGATVRARRGYVVPER
jgi:VWFA-related protein